MNICKFQVIIKSVVSAVLSTDFIIEYKANIYILFTNLDELQKYILYILLATKWYGFVAVVWWFSLVYLYYNIFIDSDGYFSGVEAMTSQ